MTCFRRRENLLLKLFRTAGYGDKKKQIDLVGLLFVNKL